MQDTENEFEKKGLPITSINEIIQDAFYFTLLLRIKRNIKDMEAKSYLSIFIKGMATIFAYEMARSLHNYKIINIDTFFNPGIKKRLMTEREWLKRNTFNSNKIDKKITDMGINLTESIYDLNVIINGNCLLDLNIEPFNEDDDIEFWNGVYFFPENALKNIFQVVFKEDLLDDVFNSLSLDLEYIVVDLENRLKADRYSYSSFKLFSNSKDLCEKDKIFIMYRYRIIQSIILIGKVFINEKLNLTIGDVINFDLKKYLRKYKAIIIDIIGNDLMGLKSDFSNNILKRLELEVTEPNFYIINRKLRDNIHYTNISILNDEEIQMLDKFQDKYLNALATIMSNNITIDIGDDDILMTNFVKAFQEKGMTKEEVDKDYENLYLKFYYTGSL